MLVRPPLHVRTKCVVTTFADHQDLLENVHMRATKLVDHLGGLDYNEHLKRLNLLTLAFCQLYGDLIEIYKHFAKYDREILLSDSAVLDHFTI